MVNDSTTTQNTDSSQNTDASNNNSMGNVNISGDGNDTISQTGNVSASSNNDMNATNAPTNDFLPSLGDISSEFSNSKWRYIVRIVIFVVMVYLLITLFAKKRNMTNRRIQASRKDRNRNPLQPRFSYGGNSVSAMMWDEHANKWLIDKDSQFCEPRVGLCTNPEIRDKWCAYTCRVVAEAS